MGLVASLGGWLAFAVAVMALVLWRQALAARAEDVARACHELRGPLAAARLGLELSAPPSVARLRAIELELDRAALALDDLQGAGRLAGVAREAELVDVGSWLKDSVEAWTPVAARRGTTVGVHWQGPSARVVGVRARLAQATGNLIANAIEHGCGPVEVRGSVKGGRVFIWVQDVGGGLSPEVSRWLEHGRARGFAPPLRRHGRVPARGRGLAIARAVAVAHGGRLRAEPSDVGASLVLELPLAGLEAQKPRP
jgi:signal transduction histidine kinase